jgi:hypothetical protein
MPSHLCLRFRKAKEVVHMNKLAVLAIVLAGITASNAMPAFAQAPRRFFPRSGQSNNVYRPNPIFAPSVVQPSGTRVVVDARGNRYVAAERFVPVWDQRQGRWVLGRTQEYRGLPPFQSRPPVDLQTSKAQWTTPKQPTIHDEFGAALGTNQIGQPASQATAPTGTGIHEGIGAAQGTNQIGQPTNTGNSLLQPPLQSQALAPATLIAASAPGQPTYRSSLSPLPVTATPEPLYAANLGIYYQPVPYDNGTFGARLTSAPVPGKPASTLPLDADDVVFLLNDQRFTNPDDLHNHFGQTTVGYIDSSTKSTQSGTITLPPRGS